MLQPAANALQAQLLTDGLHALFGVLDEPVLATLLPMVEWLEKASGEVVVREGDSDDDLYCIISGRLRAYGGSGAERRFLSEMRPGETIGEVAFFTGSARSATVIAVRDSVLVRLTRPKLESLLATYPQVMMNMARQIAIRLSRANQRRRLDGHAVNICLFPVTGTAALPGLASRLVAHVAGRAGGDAALWLNADKVDALLDRPGIAQVGKASVDNYRLLTKALDELEARHELVLYVPDDNLDSEWSQRCLRMADRILLLADARAEPVVGAAEARYLAGETRVSEADQILVLLHEREQPMPRGTARWLARRPVAGHLHLRHEFDADVGRLVRVLTGRSVGLVFGSGGARCFAQLGVLKALQQFGIAVDHVGGSSFGAIMAALVASDRPADELIAHAREAFNVSPTGDISLFPVTSLIKGRNIGDALAQLVDGLMGPGAGIEDAWKPLFCVAGDYSQASERVLRHGSLGHNLRASCAIPGLLPPVPMDGDLMVDGGTFNSLPTDVMARNGVGRIVGVRFTRDLPPKVSGDMLPSGWQQINDKLTGRQRQFRLPSLMQLMMNSGMLYSASREAAAMELADLAFNISLHGVGLLDWHKFDYAVDAGYQRAKRTLEEMPAEELVKLKA